MESKEEQMIVSASVLHRGFKNFELGNQLTTDSLEKKIILPFPRHFVLSQNRKNIFEKMNPNFSWSIHLQFIPYFHSYKTTYIYIYIINLLCFSLNTVLI